MKLALTFALVCVLVTVASGRVSNTCNGRVDAIFGTANGAFYAFRGSKYYKLNHNGNGVEPGYPWKISEHWEGLPDNIDTAFTYNRNNMTYFFKGSKYWRFDTNMTPSKGYPKPIGKNWPGIPDNLDAVLVLGVGVECYFFQGSKFYRFNLKENKVTFGPMDISFLVRYLPFGKYNISGAVQWRDGQSYLFQNDIYYKFDDDAYEKMVPAGYPKKTANVWFGCGICDGPADAMFSTNGSFYAFHGSKSYKLINNGNGVAEGYPRNIGQDWPGLPDEIDAAFTYEPNNMTYFFKGSNYWKYDSDRNLFYGYPYPIGFWGKGGIPDNLDAAFTTKLNIRSYHLKTYFFKGNNYFIYNWQTDNVEQGQKSNAAKWGLKGRISAAVQWRNGKSYFFQDDIYYKIDDRADKMVPGYPRKTDPRWFGCSTVDPVNQQEL